MGSEPGPPERNGRVAHLVLLGVLGLTVVTALAYTVLVVRHPGEWLSYEGTNLFHVRRLVHGHGLYRRVASPGAWTFPIYPPGYYVVWAPFERLAGTALWPGRVISFAGIVYASYAAGRVARRLGCPPATALASALAVPSFGAISLLLPAVRPDGLALGLAAGSLLAVTAWEDEPATRHLVVAAALSVAMIATKQNFVPLVAAYAVAFVLRDRRAAALFTASVALGGIALIALVQVMSDGAFLKDMAAFNVGLSREALSVVVRSALLPFPHPVLALAAVEVAFGLRHRRAVRAARLAWIGGCAVVISAVKTGSAVNYWAAAFLMSAVLLGPALERVRRVGGPTAAAGVAALVALLLLPQAVNSGTALRSTRRQLHAADRVDSEAVARIRRHPGRVLGDRHDLALEAGRTPELDAFLYAQLARAGEWDPAPLVADVRQHRFALVQTSFDLRRTLPTYQGVAIWPEPVVAAARQSYCLAWAAPVPKQDADGVWLYAPC